MIMPSHLPDFLIPSLAGHSTFAVTQKAILIGKTRNNAEFYAALFKRIWYQTFSEQVSTAVSILGTPELF